MRSARSGVAKQIRDMEERAIYTHCYGHALNLACSDTIKTIKLMGDSLDTAREVTKLIKDSPRRDDIFTKLKAQKFLRVLQVYVHCVQQDGLFELNLYKVFLRTLRLCSQYGKKY